MSLIFEKQTFADRLRYATYSIQKHELTNDISRIGVAALNILQEKYLFFVADQNDPDISVEEKDGLKKHIDELCDCVCYCEYPGDTSITVFDSMLRLVLILDVIYTYDWFIDMFSGGKDEFYGLIKEALKELE